MRRLRAGEVAAGCGGVALLVAMFLPWYGLAGDDAFGTGWTAYAPLALAGGTAWQTFGVLDVVLGLLALVAIALFVLQATRRSPSLPVAFSVFATIAGFLAALLILYRIANQPGPNDLVDVEYGAWLGFAAAVLIAGGGWRSMRVEEIPGAPLAPIEDLPAP